MVRSSTTGGPDPRPAVDRGHRTHEDPIVLADGTALAVRPVQPDDAGALADAFARLSVESRRLRFLSTKPTLSHGELRYLTEVDGHDHEALLAIDTDAQRGVAVARFVRDQTDPARAEAAITVTDDWQRRGVGTQLLERLADRARAEGITRFTALVSGDNRGMQALVRAMGRPSRMRRVGDGAFEYEIDLGPAGIGAQLRAALRAAAAGHLQVPPRLREILSALVPVHFGR